MFGCNRDAARSSRMKTIEDLQDKHYFAPSLNRKSALMPVRPSLPFGLLALSITFAVPALGQPLPIGPVMNAVGQAEDPAPRPSTAPTQRGKPGQVIRRERSRNGELIEYYDHEGIKRTIHDHGGNG
jgi:hypothetical protein